MARSSSTGRDRDHKTTVERPSSIHFRYLKSKSTYPVPQSYNTALPKRHKGKAKGTNSGHSVTTLAGCLGGLFSLSL